MINSDYQVKNEMLQFDRQLLVKSLSENVAFG